MIKILFVLLLIGSMFVSPVIALFAGIVLALVFSNPFPTHSKKFSKHLLQIAVVGLGFGMNLQKSLQAGLDGMLFTIVSVTGVLIFGYLIGRALKMNTKLAYLISAGTAICGGSAIAAVAPIVDSNENETSMSLAVIFILNAVALFIFPPIGHYLGLSQHDFGVWAAIAIHDTSSVVGAGKVYGEEALTVATTIKLTRALWIIPLSFVSMLFFRKKNSKINIPWFIFLFIVAMIVNTYIPIPEMLLAGIRRASHACLSVTLFLIGTSLSVKSFKVVGVRPVVLGISLWIIISLTTLAVVWGV